MKRTLAYALAVALLAACTNQEKDFQKTPVQEEPMFYASFEQPTEPGTKVYANEDLLLRWTADDRVSIFNKNTYNQQYQFTGKTGANSGGFKKVETDEFMTGNDIDHVVSVYPYQEQTEIAEDETLTLTLPSVQAYAENTFGLGANTMVSVTSDNFLQYKSVGGFLRLSLYGEGVNVSTIKLKGNNGEKLAGKATVKMSQDGTPTADLTSEVMDEIALVCDPPVALGPTAEKGKDFWFVIPPVTFSKGFTVTVFLANGEIFTKSTSRSIVIERSTLSKMSPMEVTGCTPSIPIPAAVDLGLSVKWASFNLGASSPEEYGDYYAWGETTPKERYDWSTYRWCNGSGTTLTKYNTQSAKGTVDNKTSLDPEDDAAIILLGGGWRTPTREEIQELLQNCSIVSATENGVEGWNFISRKEGYTDRAIFLPAVGYRDGTGLYWTKTGGRWWSSSLNESSPEKAWFLFDATWSTFYTERYYGYPIRPVYSSGVVLVESLSLNKTSLTMIQGTAETLTATIVPANASDKTVTWTSSDTAIATVSSDGTVTAVSGGTATITAQANDGGHVATCVVTVLTLSLDSVPVAVDLGLPSGLKWASVNLGASRPEDYGDYYAWGETDPYYSSLNPLTWREGKESGYCWRSYTWSVGDGSKMTKYCPVSSYGYNGFTDNKTVLDPEDDAAHVHLGGNWRMPTHEEWLELRDYCTMTWTTLDGVNGILLTSNVSGYSDKWIFLPAAGEMIGKDISSLDEYVTLWSSSLAADYPIYAQDVALYSFSKIWSDSYDRYYGRSIRPVLAGDVVPVESVSLTETSIGIRVGMDRMLLATVLPENAADKSVTWSCSDESIATVSSDGVVTGVAVGSAVITVTTHDGGKTATCSVMVSEATLPVPVAVDLGLPSGLKWASFNLGASKPEEYGDYYAWGETETKTDYSWSTYKWSQGSNNTLTKYNCNSSYGVVDNIKILSSEDDAATVKLGAEWHIPNYNEITELLTKCTSEWETRNGVQGRKLTSSINGNSIFIPFAGYRSETETLSANSEGYYWVSELAVTDPEYTYRAKKYYLSTKGIDKGKSERFLGFPIRPVKY